MRIGNLMLAAVMGTGLMVGCNGNEKRNSAKVESDRLTLRMTEMETQRDDYRGQVEALKADLKAAQESLTSANSNAKRLEQDLAKVRADQARVESGAADVKRLQEELATSKKEAADLRSRIAKLEQQNKELQAKAAAPQPTTRPELQK